MGRLLITLILLSTLLGITAYITVVWGMMAEGWRATWYADAGRLLDLTKEHLLLVAVSELLAIAIGLPLGFIVTRPGLEKLSPLIIGPANVGQTIPSIAFVAIMLPIMGIGFRPGVAALFVYSVLPIIRNTYAGINNIDPSIIESASGMGMTKNQILRKIELPLARPVIMAGIRTSTVINVGTATLASLIGAGGLGDLIMTGLAVVVPMLILQGAAPTAALAIALDKILAWVEAWMTPRGLKVVKE